MAVDRETDRWWLAFVVTLLAMGVGLLLSRPLPIGMAVVGVTFIAYQQVGSAPSVALKLERSISDPEPNPGDPVSVTLDIENTGGPLFDCRIVDGVPSAIPVIYGSPRIATALRSGETTSITYTVRAERGQHGFESATIITRDPSGSVEREADIETETVLTCLPPLSSVPLRSQTTQFTGNIRTLTGGSGVEFHSTREYRPGDPLSRIDWNRLAATGDLSTIDFHEERAATVVILVDARSAAYWSTALDERHVVDTMLSAAGQVFSTLLAGGDRVGIAGLGEPGCWLEPTAEAEQRHRARLLLATNDTFQYLPEGDVPPELVIDPEQPPVVIDDLLSRFSSDTQAILFSPCLDDGISQAALSIEATGHALSIISPDPTTRGTPGRTLAAIQRANRLHDLREARVRVIDWNPAYPLEIATQRATNLQ